MNYLDTLKAYDWWLNDMYMDNPIPLPVNSNPGMVFPPRQIPKNDCDAFLADIAAFVDAILNQKDLIEMYPFNGSEFIVKSLSVAHDYRF